MMRSLRKPSRRMIMDVMLYGSAKLLVEKQLLTEADAVSLQHSAAAHDQRFITHVVTQGVLDAQAIAMTLAAHFHLPYLDLDNPVFTQPLEPFYLTAPTLFELLQTHHILPIGHHQASLYIAIDDPSDHRAWHTLQFHTGMHIIPMVANTLQLAQRLQPYLTQCEQRQLSQYATQQPSTDNPDISAYQSTAEDAPVVQFIHRLLTQALLQHASDIHFEPYAEDYRIRFRQDGLLTDVTTPHRGLASRITARLKIMADMDISERRLPQDGRFSFEHQSVRVECRVSACPTVHGEKLVVRLLHTDRLLPLELDGLTLSSRDKSCLLKSLSRPQGLILVTGPTGSGKSTTLYAALNHLNTSEKNILTVEDPVEIKCHGINQVQVNTKIGLSFARVLRSFLRQDPDVIMIGEIRDLETAEIAIKASQTGHLVLATLHTNSAAESLTRLIHLGVPAFQIMGSLNLIIAQRLLRQLCPICKVRRFDYTTEDLIHFGYTSQEAKTYHFYRAQGCQQCITGYHTRIAIFEMMAMSSAMSHLIINQQPIEPAKLVSQAQKEGMRTLYQAGLTHAALGTTSFEEVMRVAL